MGRLLALAAALLAGALMAWAAQQPPRPLPVTAPAAAFSAERAMADVRAMGAAPHPTGSAANAKVRDYLFHRMAGLGLYPQVWRGQAYEPARFANETTLSGATVEDLIGILPGRDRAAPALAIMAHYDSVPASPGASDDAAGASAALETVRAIAARGTPARDVILVLTDGEEVGLIGARAFFASHPLARRIGFVINLEARGSAGRVQMFQTGAGNGETIALFRRNAERPAAQGLSAFVYERMPNDTDFTISRRAGLPGLNFAFLGRQFDYHSPSSTPPTQDPGTLQDMGAQALANAQAVAFSPRLPKSSPDLVYGSLFGDLLLAYPPWAGWLLLTAAAGLLAVGVRRALKQQRLAVVDALRGAGAALYALACSVAVLAAARRATGVTVGFLEQRPLLAQAGRWEAALVLLALGVLLFAAAEAARGRRRPAVAVALAAALLAMAFARGLDPIAAPAGVAAALIALASFGRPAGRPAAWAGVLALGLVAGVAAQATAPAVAYVIAWPLLAGCIAAAATGLGARRSYRSLAALALIAAVTLAWIGGLAHAAYLSLDLPPLLALPLLLTALVLWPLAQPGEGAPPARRAGGVLIAAGLILVAVVRFADPYSARFPQATYVAYLLDQDAARAWRVNLGPDLPAWTRTALTGDRATISKLSHWFAQRPVDAAPALAVAEPSPTITLARQPDGRLHLHASALPGARVVALRLSPDTPVRLAAVNGVWADQPLKPGAWTRVLWAAAPEGLDLTLQPGGPGKLQVRYVETIERCPAGLPPLPARPASVMPFDLSDSTLVAGSRTLTW